MSIPAGEIGAPVSNWGGTHKGDTVMQIRKAILFAAVATATAALASAASAQNMGPSFSFNLGVQSDYVFRGVSQTDEDISVFGGIDAEMGMFHLGTWASNVEFGDGTDAELDVYGGFAPTVGMVNLDFGFIWYTYPGAPKGSSYNNLEFYSTAAVPAGPGEIGVGIHYAPKGFGGVDDSVYYELNAAFPITDKLNLSGAVARQTWKGPGDYTLWHIGASYDIHPNFSIDVRYHDTNGSRFGSIFDERVVVGLTASF